MSKPSPVMTGLRCRCFKCGEGEVFRGYLTLKPACEACGQSFEAGDTADGPAFFVMFLALILFAPFFFILPLTGWPMYALVPTMLLLGAITFAFILWALRPFKAILLNLQLANRAEEAKFEDR